jgi:hypothetical protein
MNYFVSLQIDLSRWEKTKFLLGGMPYHIDPNLEKPSGGKQMPVNDCKDAGQNLLDCLNVSCNN